MPRKYFCAENGIEARCFETNDHAFFVIFGVLNEVVYLKLVLIRGNCRIVFRIDLPITIIIIDIEVFDCFLNKATPSLQANKQLLKIRVVVCEIEIFNKILDLECLVHNLTYLLIIPFLIYFLILLCLLRNLLEN